MSGKLFAAIPGGPTITGRRKLDAALYELRLGPYIDLPIWDRLSFSLSGGAAIARVDSTLEFSETVVMADVGASLSASGRGSRDDFQVGGFVAGQLSFAVTRGWLHVLDRILGVRLGVATRPPQQYCEEWRLLTNPEIQSNMGREKRSPGCAKRVIIIPVDCRKNADYSYNRLSEKWRKSKGESRYQYYECESLP